MITRTAWALALLVAAAAYAAQERMVSQPAGEFGPMPEPLTRAPVQVVESYDEYWHFDQFDRPPLLVVGRLGVPEAERRYATSDPHAMFETYPSRVAPPASFIKGYLGGDIKPRRPKAGGPTLMFIRGPQLDRGQDWGPDSVAIQGKIVTLTVSGWLDDRPRNKNIPFTRNFVLSLGELKAGDYELRLVSRSMMERDGTTGYRLQGLAQGITRFTVEAADAPNRWDAPPSDAMISERDMKPGQISDSDRHTLWQRPRFAYRGWWYTSALDYTPPGVECGVVDLVDWLKSDLYGASIPAIGKPAAGKPAMARLVGSLLYGGEWAELREVSWAGQDATIHVDVWCSDAADRERGVHRPILVLPLDLAAQGSHIRVEWHVLNALTGGGRNIDVGQAGEPSARQDEFMHDLREHSEAVVEAVMK